jgi:acyl carrier protein phosphodiesterase
MNWLAHILLSKPNVENRLGNLLGDLVKVKDVDSLNDNLKQGIARHYYIDSFTDKNVIFKNSKKRVNKNYSKFSGVLIDIFYDHFLAKNWRLYSPITLPVFTAEVYKSFESYQESIPSLARETILQIIEEDWLNQYQYLHGIENALKRIDDRIEARTGKRVHLICAIQVLEQEYNSIEQDFQCFFPEIQHHMKKYDLYL